MKPQTEKLNSSQQDREGRTPYDPTILTKLAVYQDRAKSRSRERDQTHSYWYIPSAPRVNYSHITMITEEKLVVMVMEEMSPTVFRRHRRRGGRDTFFFFLGPPGKEGVLP